MIQTFNITCDGVDYPSGYNTPNIMSLMAHPSSTRRQLSKYYIPRKRHKYIWFVSFYFYFLLGRFTAAVVSDQFFKLQKQYLINSWNRVRCVCTAFAGKSCFYCVRKLYSYYIRTNCCRERNINTSFSRPKITTP